MRESSTQGVAKADSFTDAEVAATTWRSEAAPGAWLKHALDPVSVQRGNPLCACGSRIPCVGKPRLRQGLRVTDADRLAGLGGRAGIIIIHGRLF